MSASTFLATAIAEPDAFPLTAQFKAGSIVGLIDRPGQLAGLIAALVNLGVARDKIEITRGYSHPADPSGVLDRFAELLNAIGPERELARRYRSALAFGTTVITVLGVSTGKHDAVAQALKSVGAHYIHSFGRFTVRTLAA